MQRLWRSKNNNDSNRKQEDVQIIETNLLLPNQIGCRIIQLEMEIMQTENLSKQLILQLLHEYSRAVEFYQERGSAKYLMYQKKMQNFLQKPAISQILRGKTGLMLIKKQKNQQQLKKVQNQSQVVAKKLLQDSKQSGQKQQDKIRKQLQNQERSLQQRIQRKRANSNRSNRQKVSSASFSIPEKNQSDQKDENILISEFMQLPNSNQKSGSKNIGKVYI